MQHILQFSHLARSQGEKREIKCKIVALVKPSFEITALAIERLKRTFSDGAKKYGVDDVLDCTPCIVRPDVESDLKKLEQIVESNCFTREEQCVEIPLSWMFLRSAFFKTGQLYIKTKKLKKYAQKCKIVDDKFALFLRLFTAVGSIIHIPNIPVFQDYIILNPPDFFNKLNELFNPRFNGDLEMGIVSLSTLKRMCGADVKFFRKVLISCNFAAEIDSSQLEYVECSEADSDHDYTDRRRGFPISQQCLFVPSIRKGGYGDDTSPSSLYIVHDRRLQPTDITMNAIKFLIKEFEMHELTMVTSRAHVVTRFRINAANPTSESQAADLSSKVGIELTMISRCVKHEIRITGNNSGDETITQKIIDAYRLGIEKYKTRFKSLLGEEATTHFAVLCSRDKSKMHRSNEAVVCSTGCRDSWNRWGHIIDNQ